MLQLLNKYMLNKCGQACWTRINNQRRACYNLLAAMRACASSRTGGGCQSRTLVCRAVHARMHMAATFVRACTLYRCGTHTFVLCSSSALTLQPSPSPPSHTQSTCVAPTQIPRTRTHVITRLRLGHLKANACAL